MAYLQDNYWRGWLAIGSDSPNFSEVFKPETVARIRQAHCRSVHVYPNRRPSIEGLFSISRPSAIIRRIAFIIINAFNRVLRSWFKPHIGKEHSKVMPSFTYCDASSAIRSVFLASSIKTPRHHRRPTSVLGSLCAWAANAVPMFNFSHGALYNRIAECAI